MGIFSRGKSKEEIAALEAPVASSGTINGITTGKGRGFILETSTSESIFFKSEACLDFEALTVGQNVTFKKEKDPADRLRTHAIEVRPA